MAGWLMLGAFWTKKNQIWGMKLKDQPASERPRERLREKGPDSLSPGELVAILLRTGLKGTNVVQIGKSLVQRFGSLHSLAGTSWQELAKEDGRSEERRVGTEG